MMQGKRTMSRIRSPRPHRDVLTLILLALLCCLQVVAGASDFTVVHDFSASPDGAGPQANLTQGQDGTLYGVTATGGDVNLGTLFAVTTTGVLTTLHDFNNILEGSGPVGSLARVGRDLYGATRSGGTALFSGVLYQITPDGDYTVIHEFNGFDGSNPAALIHGMDNTLYGVTAAGGAHGRGTLFQIETDGTFTTLYHFTGGSDGGTPQSLLIDSQGVLYGGTGSGYGTVFSYNPDGGQFTTLHTFLSNDGQSPDSLILGSDGKLYGTTQSGGAFFAGVVFSLGRDGSQFSVLHNFNSIPDGLSPQKLTQNSKGKLYGVTYAGGDFNYYAGTVFALNTDGTDFTTVHTFTNGNDGGNPIGLISGRSDTLFGIVSSNANGRGALFTVSANNQTSTFFTFPATTDGAFPQGLAGGSDGSFYGVTAAGGLYNGGVLFRTTPQLDTETLYNFPIGSFPTAPPVLGTHCRLFGTLGNGGYGQIYELTEEGNFTIVHTFTGGDDGYFPNALAVDSRGTIYGTTQSGGANGLGTVFSISANGKNFTTLYTFAGGNDQGNPTGALIVGKDGNLYGTTEGIYTPVDYGSVYKITPQGVLTTLFLFTDPTLGTNPVGALTQSPGGTLYGVCFLGSSTDPNTIFSVQPDGTGFALLHTLTQAEGLEPFDLTFDHGFVYGLTAGAIFRLTPDGSAFTTVHTFGGELGFSPSGIVASADGTLYGVTANGGAHSQGTVYQFQP